MPAFQADLVQAEPVVADMKTNTATVVDHLTRSDADLLVFPELFLSGYNARDLYPKLATTLDGPEVGAIADACRAGGRTCIVGLPRQGEARGTVYNSLALIGPSGPIGHYDKVYLPTFSVFEEDLFFKEGNRLPVFDTPLGRIGMCVCYDVFFPEVTKTLALSGADVIVAPSASPTISQRYFEAVFPARAIETTTWLLYTNLVGQQDETTFWGGAQAWGPRGDRKARGPDLEPAVTRVTVDLDEVEEARRKRPALRDTRADVLRQLYEAGQ